MHLRTPGTPPALDEVVLLDASGQPCGTADRVAVHSGETPLHLAFSCHLFDDAGNVLITRRALGKKTWPGVWTNSCCGHPRPGEDLHDAVRRRVAEEVGLDIGDVVPLLPDFRYRAVDASGIVENEICPVFAARVAGDPTPAPDPDEVAEWAWVPWGDLVAAVASTPRVYSPWSALQVPRIAEAFRAGPFADAAPPLAGTPSPEPPPDPAAATVAAVDRLLAETVADLAREWDAVAGGLALDVLAHDLPAWLDTLVLHGGKRLRVRLAHGAFVAAGGVPQGPAHAQLVRVAAAVEMLHLFALIHDDVMDESDSRRGRPAAHVEAATWHRDATAYGERALFGRNLAILLGDLAHLQADRLVDPLPERLRRVWYELSVELIAGQRADLTGAAAGRRDLAHAEHVSRVKSGRYTVVRPLQLGALAAGAPDAVADGLMRAGESLGRAFALRDDLLGVWGDPATTGKPAGDDLFEGKATVLLALAGDRLTGPDARLLGRVGTQDFHRWDAPALADAMRRAGIEQEVEAMIAADVADALAELDALDLRPDDLAGLRATAHQLAWRDA